MTGAAPPSTPVAQDLEGGGVLYEARYEAATDDTAGFDTWLRDRIADVLQSPGFVSAEILEQPVPTPPGTVVRTVQYRVRDADSWGAFAGASSESLERLGGFGELCTLQRRVFHAREQFQRGAVSTENCLNCGEVLRGQHCLHCGQRARVRVLSLWALLRDVLGDLLDWDARIWRTLRPLAFRPGLLTQEFLRGRRTHYTPPFRMYLILSVAFFLTASLVENVDVTVREDGVQLRLEGDTAPAAPEAPAATLDPAREAQLQRIVDELREPEHPPAQTDAQTQVAGPEDTDPERSKTAAKDPCGPESLQVGLPGLQDWEPRIREACRRIVADQQGFASALYDNVPRMLFVFLPLVALLMQLLYAGSGRFYVEHLLFFVHYHAYLFLGALVLVLLGLADAAVAGTPVAAPLATATNAYATAFIVWSPLYLYLAMRRVYGQGRALTLLKYTLLGLGYVFGLLLTALVLLAWTALSI